MNRRAFLKVIGSTAVLLPLLPHRLWAAATNFRRLRPSDAGWPSASAWKKLSDAVGGNLIPVNFPFSASDPTAAAAALSSKDLKNPYYIGDQPGLTETLGWVDGWATKPSAYAVAARNAN
ncbi:MAG: hypothetical protein WAM05_11065, partial [Candidatus Binataceae bacterium]